MSHWFLGTSEQSRVSLGDSGGVYPYQRRKYCEITRSLPGPDKLMCQGLGLAVDLRALRTVGKDRVISWFWV